MEPWSGRAVAACSLPPPPGRGRPVPGRAAGDGEDARALRSCGADERRLGVAAVAELEEGAKEAVGAASTPAALRGRSPRPWKSRTSWPTRCC